MEILFLGTSAAVPSRDRSTSCIAVREGADIALLDCGEGSQRQIMTSPYSFMKIQAILITHLHGDHVFGLPGLVQTMGLSGRKDPLTICGPKGLRAFFESTMTATGGEATYPITVEEVEGGESLALRGFNVYCFPVDHGIPAVGYILRGPPKPGKLDREKALALGVKDGPDMARLKAGKPVNGVRPEDVVGPMIPGTSVAYTGDTRPCPAIVEAVRDADVLIHEATYMDSETVNAHEHFHSTASQAARAAVDANVRHLVLTHISHRYDDREAVVEEARATFPESYAADDMRHFEITRAGLRVTDIRRA